jgi:class 3 adenylate cyclase/predicted ATPase
MNCPRCTAVNPEQARFCLGCGMALLVSATSTCASCGRPMIQSSRFCPECGRPAGAAQSAPAPPPAVSVSADALQRLMPRQYVDLLLSSRGRVAAERKVVTILFADMVGSTAMAEKLDPEEVMEIMNGAFRVLIEPIYRFEGTLARLMGDAVLCFFGAPVAHEDDPARACRAALEILAAARCYGERLRTERGIAGFSVRIGINTGLVVVGEVGHEQRVEYTAMGDAVNLAARMEAAAKPGTVLITEETHRQIAHKFRTEPVGAIEVKGKSVPVSAYRLLAAGESVSRAPSRLARSVLVGRKDELALLRSRLDRLSEGHGSVVGISAAPGLGKTRLAAEARVLSPPGVRWVEGRCHSYQEGTSYAIARELLWALLEVSAVTEPAEVARRLEASLAGMVTSSHGSKGSLHGPVDPADSRRIVADLGRIVQLPDELCVLTDGSADAALGPEAMTRRLRSSFGAYLRGLARQRPLVLVWEDLHWIDHSSLALLETLVPLVADVPVLMLLLFRPREGLMWETHQRLAREQPALYSPVELLPLSRAASSELLSNLLQVEVLPAATQGLILDATEGNAFFLEELLRSLLDAAPGSLEAAEASHEGAAPIEIPHTLHGAISARVDRLDSSAKRVLQTASVIGRLFPLRVLNRMLSDQLADPELTAALAELERRDFVIPAPSQGEGENRPVSTLSGVWRRIEVPRERPSAPVKEIQYAFKHAMLAEVTYRSLLKADRRDLHRRAGEATEELYPDRIDQTAWSLAYHFERGGMRARAYAYYVRAGDGALCVYANREAADCFRRAIELASSLERFPEDAGRGDLHEKLGDVSYLMSDYAAAAQAFEHALAHAEGPHRRAALHRKCGQVFEKWGRYDRALASFEAGIEVMAGDLDLAEAAGIYSGLSLVYYHKNQIDSAVELGQLALDMMRRLGDRRGAAQALNNLGIAHGKRSEWELAAKYHEEGLAIWSELGDAYGLASTHNNLGLVARHRRDWDAAVANYEKSLAQFEKLGNQHGVARAYDNLGQVLIDQNRVEEAMEYVRKAVTILGEISIGESGIAPEMWQSGAW